MTNLQVEKQNDDQANMANIKKAPSIVHFVIGNVQLGSIVIQLIRAACGTATEDLLPLWTESKSILYPPGRDSEHKFDLGQCGNSLSGFCILQLVEFKDFYKLTG